VTLTEGRFVENLEAALDSLDQPTFDGLNAYYMSHAIRAAGFTVALSGTGGDELFGGYTSYRDLPVLQRWSRRTAWVPRGLQVAAAKVATWLLCRSSETNAASDPLGQAPGDGPSRRRSFGALPAAYALFLPGFQRELLAPGFAVALATACPWPCASGSAPRPGPARHSRHQRHGAAAFPWRAAAARQRRGQMAASLEQRVPLVDQVLFESVDRLPDQARYPPLAGRRCCGALACAASTPHCSSGPRAGLCCRSIAGSARPAARHGRDSARPASHRSGRASTPQRWERLWLAFLAGAPGMLLVAGVVHIRFHPMVHRNRVFR